VAAWRAWPGSRRGWDPSAFVEERRAVAEICARVFAEGDDALRDLGRRFDGWAPAAGESFAIDVGAAINEADREALSFAAARIREFHERHAPSPQHGRGGGLELVARPVTRAGIYAPGGRAAYPSTVLMTAIPARVAGVTEVVLATPPRRDGSVPAAILAAAQIAGVDRVYRVGGAQAIAAFAYGTESIPRVDVVAGPGNIYVTLAKREVFGSVGVDGIAGPTEVLVLADSRARPDFVAADLAAQLEHDPLAWGVLVTDSAELAGRVEHELADLVRGLERAEVIRAATCCLIVARDMDEAVEVAEEFAPEHLLVVADGAERIAGRIRNAGAVFVGPYATVPLGDYVAGPNHTLPTSGAARFASPLGVNTFLKSTSVLRLDRADVEGLEDAAVRIAAMEGLGAHAHAIEVRLE
jgi:histidinol dehydrogenase